MAEPRKSAAAIILQDADGAQPRVLLAKRSPKLRYMPGHHAFPGGALDDGEGAERVVHATHADDAPTIFAAAREIFEETGIPFASGALPPAEALREARKGLLGEKEKFGAILERFGLRIDARIFEPAGRFISPILSPIRFDTRYFLIRAPLPSPEELLEGELVSLDWIPIHAARDLWRKGAIQLPPPVALALRQLARWPIAGALARLNGMEPPASEEPPAPIEIRRGVSILPLRTPTLYPATHTNCVIIGEEDLYVIDPGPTDPAEQDRLATQLEYLLQFGRRVAAVILTHSHIDHAGGAAFLRDRFDAPIWAHGETARQLGFPIDRRLEAEERIAVAGDPAWVIRCIHTPGHDPGHLCYLEESARIFIAGDMVSAQSTIAVSRRYGGDMGEYLLSLERMTQVPHDILVPGHGFFTPKGRDLIAQHIERRMWREARIQGAWESGVRDVKELMDAVYDDLPAQVRHFAEDTLKAHMARLEIGDFGR